MRSIRLQNILQLQKQRLAEGTAVCKTSRSFVFATIGSKEDHIHVQRGYRQFGQMHEGTLQALEITEEKNIDYVLLKERLCDCNCMGCSPRKLHPIYNCREVCVNSETQIKQDFIHSEGAYDICSCNCSFCTSGRINKTHKTIDCILHCRNSEVRGFEM